MESASTSKEKHICRSLYALSQVSEFVEIVSTFSDQMDAAVGLKTFKESKCSEFKVLPNSLTRGTIITLKNVFYSLPVRKRSLNSILEVQSLKSFCEKMSILYHYVHWKIFDSRNRQLVLEAVGQASITKRLQSLFSFDIISKMKYLKFSKSGFCIEGFISPPSPEFCHWNKSLQNIYYEKVWISVPEILSSTINIIYSSVFSNSPDYGPAAKHANIDAMQNLKNPLFFLSFYYPSNFVEIVRDGDKKIPFYQNDTFIRLFIRDSLLNQFSTDYPLFQSIAEDLFLKQGSKSEVTKSVDRVFSQFPSTVLSSEPHRELQLNSSLFSLAFLPSNTTKSSIAIAENKQPKQAVHLIADKGASIIRTNSDFISDKPFEMPNNLVNDIRSNLSSKNEALQTLLTYLGVPLTCKTYDEDLVLRKEILSTLQLISQWDQKYLLAYSNSAKLLVAIDQHACDERIKYEFFLSLPIEVSCLVKPLKVSIFQSLLTILHIKKALFEHWGFQYDFSEREPVIWLQSLPVVAGETLTVEDFIEFCDQIQSHFSLPDTAQQPPAVQRILMSKACRNAVKFGESLSWEKCQELIDQLKLCSLPFQCAHGRPSILPLLQFPNDWN